MIDWMAACKGVDSMFMETQWALVSPLLFWKEKRFPESKVHGANIWPTWVLSAPDGPHVGPMSLDIRVRVYHTDPQEDDDENNVAMVTVATRTTKRNIVSMKSENSWHMPHLSTFRIDVEWLEDTGMQRLSKVNSKSFIYVKSIRGSAWWNETDTLNILTPDFVDHRMKHVH